jgi:hypothetical protein
VITIGKVIKENDELKLIYDHGKRIVRKDNKNSSLNYWDLTAYKDFLYRYKKDGYYFILSRRRIYPPLYISNKNDSILEEFVNEHGKEIKDKKYKRNCILDIMQEVDISRKYNYYTVSYGSSVSIENHILDEPDLYAISPFGAVVVYRKKGGYLAYTISNNDGYLNTHQIPVDKAIDLINKIRKKKNAIKYNEKKAKEIYVYEISNKL